MTRRDRHKQERLDRIRAAAWDLFRTQGYEHTTIRQISERADVAVGTVNVLGGSKASLLISLFQAAIEDRLREFRVDAAAPLEDRLYDCLNFFLCFYEAQPDLARHFMRETLYGDRTPEERGEELARIDALMGLISGWLTQEQQAGRARADVEPLLFSQTVFALYLLTLQSWLAGLYPLNDLRATLRRGLQATVLALRP
ncbi:TetR/AcrR family transcriptional regulator [Deinococcus ficus]|uniref:TetR/AcrR family transcriptional regulator n=1 Tax=Deinococcus ficus TaxID=317577 RepID=UPI000418554C|nr:helix-turn-helix domain-containing protein [Deinococcus ficus]